MIAKGCNGMFGPKTIRVWVNQRSKDVHVGFWPRMDHSEAAPCALAGSEKEMLDLCKKILDALPGLEAAVCKARFARQFKKGA